MTLWRGLCNIFGHAWSGTSFEQHDHWVTQRRHCHRCGLREWRSTIPLLRSPRDGSPEGSSSPPG